MSMKIELSDGQLLEIIDTNDASNLTGELYDDARSERIVHQFNESIRPIVRFADDVLGEFKGTLSPSSIEIEFGAEAGGEGGLFGLARTHAKATVNIKLTWNSN
jgi:hypothetical protein